MKPARIRILESAFAKYIGVMFGVEFKDGVSVNEIPYIDQQRICSIMKAETLDGENVSGSAALANGRNITAKDAIKHEAKAEPIIESKRESVEITIRYSRAELEAIADKGGIAALRQIGNDLGVREKSIEVMIEKILVAVGGE
ncbi:hypothetical protein AB6G19_23190 [Providencia manganoxydans]|uniref:hypothetical protein n=1 Tax=Providencia manganoxydans TaxID=2923283 RepID=UPI0032D9F049